MEEKKSYRPENLHYLKMLARQYPNVQAASTEIINLHAQQIDIQLRLEEKLRKLVPETPAEEKPVEFCAHCGTQLPPGGKTCPSCHELNQ